MNPEMSGLILGLAMAREREDGAGWAALRFGADRAMTDEELFFAALDTIQQLAGAQASEELPYVGAEGVLQRWALEVAE